MPDPNTDSTHRDRLTSDRPGGGFDLIITALDPHATDWLAHTDWDALLTTRGLVAVVTHSDTCGGRLLDPLPVLVGTFNASGLRCLDHIAVLTAPTSDPAAHPAGIDGDSSATRPHALPARTGAAGSLPLRRDHRDLILFTRRPLPTPEGGVTGGTETSDV
ncbi:hypothetical protein [Amycolatopsis jejuensis]|uniref:hypothetical protein n=1 Tax=Amycolatopsis jejuensis TaxID=330084 RepID=UPI000AD74B3E|nr:hypothetical protein [Amycolatopsis jejuensis]